MRSWRKQLPPGTTVGFVPTMGCLHEGHMHLVQEARAQCDRVLVSIFVNPTQFGPNEDFDRYPRTFDHDIKLLKHNGVEALFYPSVSSIYPERADDAPITSKSSATNALAGGTFVEVVGKSHQLEGAFRPTHFRGVATVCTKLFNLVQPTKAFFGQKDAQQCAVLRSIICDLFMPLEMVVCPTTREPDGLAMSSRNRYLTPEQRRIAPRLYQGLCAAQSAYKQGERDAATLLFIARDFITQEPAIEVQYLSLAHPRTLAELKQVEPAVGALFSGTIRVGNTRLLDNLLLDCQL